MKGKNMKSKCGIVTLYGLFNYGNRLQNYASQIVLEDLGFEVYTLVIQDYIQKKTLNEKFKHYIKLILRKSYRAINKNEKLRAENFVDFEKNIHEHKIYSKNLNKISDEYDFFVVGSDQVWNPYYMVSKDWFFLKFCNPAKRITMAPSIGLNKLPKKFIDEYEEYLRGFARLSCREYEGAKILEEITHKPVEKVLDPTMLVSVELWEKLAKKPQKFEKRKYVFLYFLGEITPEYQDFINSRIEEGYSIVNILDKLDYFYTFGPNEFLWLIKNSSLVVTDSFHACVFSILFQRPFVVFERQDASDEMTSRIYTLLRNFNLEDRIFNRVKNIYCIDYNTQNEILQKEKQKSLEFLKKSFGLK
ncbi:MAG: polysaccharide pyruvyl transferase family protein [Thomasclavelia spiroformis]